MPKPDLQKFLNDPAFTEDRNFLEGVITATLEKKAAEAKKKKEEDERANPPSIFDQLFG